MKRSVALIFIVLCAVAGNYASAKRFNDKIENRPYADLKPWHLGFSIGMNVQDLRLTHNGFITDDGEEWRAEQVNYQPGFSVSGLINFRLNKYFSLRLSPGMMFGSRDIRFLELKTGATERQSIKSVYVVAPLDLKFAAQRVRNARPYIIGGVMPAFDVSKKRDDFLKLTTADCYLTVGFGCDFYLPYFKLIPEVRFSFGLTDILTHNRPELEDDPIKFKYTQSLSKATSKMISLVFYFE